MKRAAALALLLGSATVHAQTSVTFYGIADAALVVEDGGSAGRITKVTSGAAAASRFGFRGVEFFAGIDHPTLNQSRVGLGTAIAGEAHGR